MHVINNLRQFTTKSESNIIWSRKVEFCWNLYIEIFGWERSRDDKKNCFLIFFLKKIIFISFWFFILNLKNHKKKKKKKK